MRRHLIALLLALAALPAAAQISAPMYVAPPTAESRVELAPPLRLAESAAPLAQLAPAAEAAAESLEVIRRWNQGNGRPWRNGFVRPLPDAGLVRLGAETAARDFGALGGGLHRRAADGALVWGAEVRVEEAWRLRLRLADVRLPAGARLWVYDEQGRSRAFGPELAYQGVLWTPSVAGPAIRLEVAVPAELAAATEPWSFRVDGVLQMVELDASGAPRAASLAPRAGYEGECLEDSACIGSDVFPAIEDAKRSVVQLFFVEGSSGWVCSGNLINDIVSSGDPLVLTAQHCVTNQAEASTLETTFDFFSAACGQSAPDFGSLPWTAGAMLLVSRASTDVSLLRLPSVPGGRTYLGWTSDPAVFNNAGTYHRLSHPLPGNDILAQSYSQHQREANFNLCEDVYNDPGAFHHTRDTAGGTFGGSSGSGLMTGQGLLVGQLVGACPTQTSDAYNGCDRANDTVDGAFAKSFAALEPYLVKTAACPAGFFTDDQYPGFCFKVEIFDATGAAVSTRREASCQPDTVCVSGQLPGRSEIFLRVLGPRPNGYLWPTIVRFTPSRVRVTVLQQDSGVQKVYDLAEVPATSSNLSGEQDREGFLP